MLGLHCCTGFSVAAASRGYSLVMVPGLFTSVASPVAEHGLYSAWTSVVVAWGLLSCGSQGFRAQAQ